MVLAPPDTALWPVKDIVYVSIVGAVMLAAFLEWILWLSAFMYCLVKVFIKAENASIRVLSVIIMIFFSVMRLIFLPVMLVTLPLPPEVRSQFPETMVRVLQLFAFWTFSALLTVPWLFCVYQLVTHSVGRKRRIKHVLNEHTAPKVVVVMPCYKEDPEILLRTVDSLVDCDYPPTCLHVFLSFDGDQEDELYLNTIEQLGVPMTLKTYPKSIDLAYRGTRVTVSRFPHGGKRSCQKKTFKLMDKVYAEYIKRHDNLFVLFIDSDCILDKVCIQNFMYEMELKPGSKRNMLAMTGVITSTTTKNTLITILQDMEYIHGQLFERSVESGCGAVTCLPGALTILRFSAFRKMAKYYFADKAEQCDDLFDYGKCHLGEDRWLTHLFMIGAKERYQIQMNTGAFCKTEAVQTYKSLLKQRRRWFLGFITNEVCMLTDWRLWRQYPLLLVIRFAQNTIRTTALLFFILVISLLSTAETIDQLPVGFIAVSLGLNWILMLYFGAKLGRYKIMLYPLMFVVNPFFNWVYMVYGIFTAGQRTWGGPRADAGTADTHTSPQAVIEHAKEIGDELNVVPESFKPALEAVTRKKSLKTTVQPSDRLEGQFAAPEQIDTGLYKHDEESRHPAFRTPGHSASPSRRHSDDSYLTDNTMNHSVYRPRRPESFMGPQDLRLYQMARAAQKPAGGAFYTLNTSKTSGGQAKVPLARANTVPRDRSSSRVRHASSRRGSAVSNSSFMSTDSDSDQMPASHNPFSMTPQRRRYYSRERSPLANPSLPTPIHAAPRQHPTEEIEMSNLDGADSPQPPENRRRGRDPTPRPEVRAPPVALRRHKKLRKRSLSSTASASGSQPENRNISRSASRPAVAATETKSGSARASSSSSRSRVSRFVDAVSESMTLSQTPSKRSRG